MGWVLAFAVALVIDYVTVRYTAAAASGALSACGYSPAIRLLNYLTLVVVLDDWRAIVPAALGDVVGTYLGTRQRRKSLARPRKPTAAAYFSPSAAMFDVLVDAIDHATSEVLVLASSLTNVSLAMALERAQKRVEVRVVLSPADEQNPASQLGALFNAGIDVEIDDQHPFLREYSLVIDEDLVATGSFPFTGSAEKHTAASLVILEGDKRLALAYKRNFLLHEQHARKPFALRVPRAA